MPLGFGPILSLTNRELVRFLRQKNRVIGALATPIVFWLLIGSGMGNSFRPVDGGETHYLNYFFPGSLLMILLFTAIFSTISIIEDRREGFLQGVLVAPVGRSAIVAGKVLGGAILATSQAYLFLILGWVTGIVSLDLGSLIAMAASMFIISIALTALGVCIAWRMSSTQGFHAIMNLFLMPMWMLSGALFPLTESTPTLMKIIIRCNPLSYALDLMRHILSATEPKISAFVIQLLITVIFALATLFFAGVIARRRSTVDSM